MSVEQELKMMNKVIEEGRYIEEHSSIKRVENPSEYVKVVTIYLKDPTITHSVDSQLEESINNYIEIEKDRGRLKDIKVLYMNNTVSFTYPDLSIIGKFILIFECLDNFDE